MLAKFGRFLTRIRRRITQPARQRAMWLDQILEKLAVLSQLLLGEAGTTKGALSQQLSLQQTYLQWQLEMRHETEQLDVAGIYCSDEPGLMSSRLCDAQEFQIPEICCRLTALGYDPADVHRKHWQKAAIAFIVEQLGYFDDQSTGLGLGVAAERLLYLFSNHCGRVVGIDSYRPTYQSGAAMTCEDVYAAAPFEYRRERLEILAMDMRRLDFSEAEFNFIWSVSSVEHVDSIGDWLQTFREIERVLKPGGHAIVSTEWNWLSANPIYRPGAIVLDATLHSYLLSRLESLRRIGPVHLYQSHHLDHVFLSRWVTGSGEEMASGNVRILL